MPAMTAPKKSVIVVEDETLLRLIAVDIFEEAGFNVFAAETADHGAYILEDAERIDGVFTDVETPGQLNGVGLARIAELPIRRRLQRMGEEIGEPDLARFDLLKSELEQAFARLEKAA